MSPVLHQQLRNDPSLVDVTQAGVGEAKLFARCTGGLQECEVKVCEGAVLGFSVAGQFKVAPVGSGDASKSTEGNDWPFPEIGMMCFPAIAEIYDERVVEHGAISLAHGGEARSEAGDEFAVKLPHFYKALLACEIAHAFAMAVFVAIDGDAQLRPREVLLASTAAGESDYVAESRDERCCTNFELRFESVHFVGFGKVGIKLGHGSAECGLDGVDFSLAQMQRFKCCEVIIEFLAFAARESIAGAADVVAHEIEQVCAAVKLGSRLTLENAAE